MDDNEILKRIKSGDAGAIREIIKKYSAVVYNHARSFLRNEQEAEDVSQEVFININKNIKKFRGDSKLSTWIYRITVNACKNRLKQMKRHRARLMEGDSGGNAEDNKLEKMAERIREKEEKEPDNLFYGNVLKEAIMKRIGELPEEQKSVIILRDIDGLAYDEIGSVLKISVPAVKSKLFRARESLREKLEKDGIL
ncbi:MAG TPA: sigma-70 family RNA polymerase sigma factor [bacterium]|nr:sigma-70 family RNA polymerase sigma factor [bacterium]